MLCQLTCHPDTPARGVQAIDVRVSRLHGRKLCLSYLIHPARTIAFPDHGSGRRDNLWRSTCFEFFVKRAGEASYREFNFAPLDAWAGYEFSDWRVGMTNVPDRMAPHLVDCRAEEQAREFPDRYALDVILPEPAIPIEASKASLTAVIEELDGTKSYWALAHPPGKPDFHHPACFVLELPAAG